MSEINRRQFVQATVALACACCTCDAFAEAAKESGSKTVDCGSISDFSKDAVTDKWATSEKFFIVRHEGKIYAPSAICSHKRKQLKIKDGKIFCPGHGSKFDDMGVPTKGPASTPLYRYKVTKDEKGHLVVDKTKQFEEKEWDKEGAFVEIG
ncbi:MAG TPA: Rieske 2Fe-2S domain-containing protein [Tepidisphaeraceae bacterium]|jgi:nitrite reductase/ring-hydroxylating ferredoxin subunit